ncbi:MAG: HAMP domain-containing protein [Firmicutes bacterium]|nr:HAMP domain-containing protein [Bacillota bacterium]
MPRLSLTTKSVLAIVALFLPILVLLIVDFQKTYEGRVDSVLDGLESSDNFLSTLVDFTLDEGIAQARSFALQPRVQTLNPDTIYPFLVAQSQLFSQYDDIAVVDTAGWGIVSVHNPPGQPTVNVADRDYFRQAMATGQPVVSGLLTSRATGRNIVVTTAPISGPDGKTVGLVITSLSIEHLKQVVASVPLPAGHVTFLTDPAGRLAFQLGAPPEFALEGRAVSDYPPVATVLGGRSFRGTVAASLLGDERAVVASRTPKFGGVVGVSISTSSIRAENVSPSLERMAVYLGVLVALLLAGFFITQRAIIRPLSALREGVAAFGAGNLRQQVEVRTGDELEDVAQAFNRMAEQVLAREEALRESREQREDLLRTVSHDLRNPLTTIQGRSQLLLKSLVEAGERGEEFRSVEAILTSARRMNAMIQDLVDMARIEAGQLQLEMGTVDLRSFVDELLERAKVGMAIERIEVEIPADLPPVRADSDRLERVFVNLLTNALKYSPDDTEVVLRAARSDDELQVSVTDRGIGIASVDLPHVFERYFRATDARRGEGIGLGLYITKMLVQAHGGRVWVESPSGGRMAPGPGNGSTFYFTLPLG